jgi:hypothetical protein
MSSDPIRDVLANKELLGLILKDAHCPARAVCEEW